MGEGHGLPKYYAPFSIADALEFLGQKDVEIVAGGTDFFPALGGGRAKNTKGRLSILDITRIPELSEITKTEGGWRIGAGVTFTQIIEAPLAPFFEALKQAARQIGSQQVQNTATLAGNICNASPAADSVPVLLSLNGEIEIIGREGTRHIPIADFIVGPRQTGLRNGEMLRAIFIPDHSENAKSAFQKLGSRAFLVISIAMVAVVLDLQNNVVQNARIAVGACGPKAQRLRGLERAIIGLPREKIKDLIITEAHLSPLCPIDDTRARGAYRLDAVKVLCVRALLEASHG